MKTFKELKESINDVGVMVDFINPADRKYLRDYFAKISGAFQPNVSAVLKTIEDHLRKFGYTLNMEPEEFMASFPESDKIMLAIYAYSTKQLMKNAYITFEWSTLSSGQQFYFRSQALHISANVLIYETSPAVFDQIMNTYDVQKDGDGYVSLVPGDAGHAYR